MSLNPSTGGSNSGEAAGKLSAGSFVGAGRFLLKHLLGEGGMGIVWLAEDTRLREDVALKFVPREIRGDPVALDDMRRETLKSRKLSHPNIVRIHDLFESPDEAPFISMEYVEGSNLSALRLQQPNRVFTWEFLKPLVRQLCEALDYAHGENFIHRDLKPANIMLDRNGRLKLADFGIAATLNESATRVSVRHPNSGTITYMSPQQMDGEVPKVTDDIYSFGATLYEWLSSKPPFYSGDVSHQVRNIPARQLEGRLLELQISNPIPPEVEAMVMSCLSKDPADRPPGIRAVMQQVGLAGGVAESVGSEPAIEPFEGESALMHDESEHSKADTHSKPYPMWGVAILCALLLTGGVYLKVRHNRTRAETLEGFWRGDAQWVQEASGVNLPGRFTSIITNGPEFWAYYPQLDRVGVLGETDLVSVVSRVRSADGILWKSPEKALEIGPVQWVFPARDAKHATGRAEGNAWAVQAGRDGSGHMVYGPYKKLPAGNYMATFELMIDQHTGANQEVGYVDVCKDGRSIAINNIFSSNFRNAYTYQDFNLIFSLPSVTPLEFRTLWHGFNYLKESQVLIAARSEPDQLPSEASIPAVWKEGGKTYLVYEGEGELKGDLCLAVATDGINFEMSDRNPILRRGKSGWDRLHLGAPSLWHDAGGWRVYYCGHDETGPSLGLAAGASLESLEKHPMNPILKRAELCPDWAFGRLGKLSAILKSDGNYYLACDGKSGNSRDDGGWSIALARSTNGVNWSRHPANPIIRSSSPSAGIASPEWVVINGHVYLYGWQGGNASAQSVRFALARKPR